MLVLGGTLSLSLLIKLFHNKRDDLDQLYIKRHWMTLLVQYELISINMKQQMLNMIMNSLLEVKAKFNGDVSQLLLGS